MIKHKARLNPNQEIFCRLYASDREFFGNGVASYLEAYDMPPSKYKSALAAAGRLLVNGNVLKRIDELLDITVNNQVVDKELGFTIIQKRDLSSKVAAIREYNRVKQRVDDAPKTTINIGVILKELENGKLRRKVIRQVIPATELLSDSRQTTAADYIPKKQGADGF